MQVYNYLSKREAALLLYTSLTGEAEEILETATLERINYADGIDYIVSFLKSNLDTKLVYQKRKLLGDFERASSGSPLSQSEDTSTGMRERSRSSLP